MVENGKFIGEVAMFLDWRKVIDGIGYFGLLRKRKWLGRGTWYPIIVLLGLFYVSIQIYFIFSTSLRTSSGV